MNNSKMIYDISTSDNAKATLAKITGISTDIFDYVYTKLSLINQYNFADILNRSVFIILTEIPMNMSRAILSRLLPKNNGTDVKLSSKKSVKPRLLRTVRRRKRATVLPETFG